MEAASRTTVPVPRTRPMLRMRMARRTSAIGGAKQRGVAVVRPVGLADGARPQVVTNCFHSLWKIHRSPLDGVGQEPSPRKHGRVRCWAGPLAGTYRRGHCAPYLFLPKVAPAGSRYWDYGPSACTGTYK